MTRTDRIKNINFNEIKFIGKKFKNEDFNRLIIK